LSGRSDLTRRSILSSGSGSRQDKLHTRAGIRFAVEPDLAAELLRHDIVDDVQTKPCRTPVAASGEERIEGLSFDFRRHAAAVIGDEQLDVIVPVSAQPDVDCSLAAAAVECMRYARDPQAERTKA
jgi:hypothetical protein